MNSDKLLMRWLVVLLVLPVVLAFAAGDRFRYPCQDPKNWDKEICQRPLCEATRTCPEYIFKNEDPRKGTSAPSTTAVVGKKECN